MKINGLNLKYLTADTTRCSITVDGENFAFYLLRCSFVGGWISNNFIVSIYIRLLGRGGVSHENRQRLEINTNSLN